MNQFYPLLDEVGSWKGSSDQLCDSVHALAAQADCVSGSLNATAVNQARPECQQGIVVCVYIAYHSVITIWSENGFQICTVIIVKMSKM